MQSDDASLDALPDSGHSRPALDRALRERGRQTARRLLAAGLAEFSERGFHAVTVDDITRRADTSHGTFYLYFASKDDLFGALAQQALDAMDSLADQFPMVTPGSEGRGALRAWIGRFRQVYAAHAAVIGLISQADGVGAQAWESGLKLLFHLADVISWGMTATRPRYNSATRAPVAASTRLTALACLTMLERVSYLTNAGVDLPAPEMTDRLTAILMAAFRSG